ncbi:MAG: DNA repair protein RecN [Anaerolineales bacterium]|jgi:DNA repair protein RecN (Recombination protein N)
MLQELRIKDFAIIDDIHLELSPGFVVLTGETGAGKSIIIDAVELLLGGRAESAVIRTGAKTALIEGTFRIHPAVREPVNALLEAEDLLEDRGFVTLGREIRREERNICRVNGRTANLGLLREIGEHLVDVHGQSEHLSLLRVREHLNLLDRFAKLEGNRNEFTDLYIQLAETRRKLAELRRSEQDAARRADMLAFQINEIEAAALRPGEETTLREERTRLSNAEQLARETERAIAALAEGPHDKFAASDLLGEAVEALADLAKVDASMETAKLEGQALLEQLGEMARQLRVYREQIEFNPSRLDEVEERLSLIYSLGRKYGEGIEAILSHAQAASRELESITHAEERIQALEAREQDLLGQMGTLGEALSSARRQAGDQLAAAIEAELVELRMPGARFGAKLRWEEDPEGAPIHEKRVGFTQAGMDRVEFLVSPNPGEDLKPLIKIASGGETSRMMLGMKGVLAQADSTPTLIFDEIDQGIGGRVGAVVGRKLWNLARSHQVLCVTHLPQLAAYGDRHYSVEKQVDGGRTVTRVRRISGKTRASELAKMLGGTSQSNLESAQELLRQAKEGKAAQTQAEAEGVQPSG